MFRAPGALFLVGLSNLVKRVPSSTTYGGVGGPYEDQPKYSCERRDGWHSRPVAVSLVKGHLEMPVV